MLQIKTTKGSALLTALFIMTLVAIVATAMSTKVQLDIYRTKLILTHDKVYLSSQAVTFWALGELNNNKNKFTKADAQGIVSVFPRDMEHIDSTVTLSGALYDLQAQYNINNLENRKSMLGFINLIGVALPQIPEAERVKLTLAVNDWLSPYDLARGKDNYLSYYMSQKPPYYPSHQLMSSKSELRLVKDVSAPLYLALEPLITTLPESTPININTAPIKVLKSLSSSMKETQLNELLKARKENGIKDLSKVSEILKKLNIANDQVTLESTYFLSIASATSDNLTLTVYTVFKRSRDKNQKISVNVLRESFNIF
ncbi:type II secretion system minor pseudopilin GspK [Legionella anisa]|uniref:Type II secretion system protein K n=1 Tax=Legionella anisa TaxID=28082 RepID=A0AAX0WSK3_9GAMM|nr:type II secretion system minor pseudopilin GspK [Legionella anisa]AWN74492.1 general secretion pathway protein GspK [Legionella anisa]KTC70441.1 type II secretory pathway protein LspK [Legionella anisa]MBN5936771.1 type II secretion system minor pseudopilin GspK [Legionella anisa]MCW8425398.1 type II secretion system minor pseudopilin GspK [Legionella anisa]MCW8449171.1 type II secretion system minor pseudopilin GspK [Legionella anisa]